jgi:alginate O-acetyltransferase complex protein AlgI
LFRGVAWVAFGWFIGWRGVLLLCVAALVTHGAAALARGARSRPFESVAYAFGAAGAVAPLVGVGWFPQGVAPGAVVCVMVFTCHALSYLADARRRAVDTRHHVDALLYLLQFPVILAGPLSRFPDFRMQLSTTDVSMASFSYGVRRMLTGAIKVWLLAAPLLATADRIFGLRVTRLSTGTAWLGAACAALSAYFVMSGLSDVGIGAGRIAGLRYQENFRRPYTADSLREFWRRWNITLIAWLRDYVAFPIAGHGGPATRLYPLAVAGFVIVGAWHEWRWRLIVWAMYFATWLAIETIWLGTVLLRLPRVVRHVYVVGVVTFGWMILRANGPGPLLGYVESMLGLSMPTAPSVVVYLTPGFVLVLIAAIIFAGPSVGSISRWRVSVDAATASLLMMFAATGVFIWHLAQLVWRLVLPSPKRSR